MTKKDFELIAHAIATLSPSAIQNRSAAEVKAEIARNFSHHLSRTNARFDADRFEAAALK